MKEIISFIVPVYNAEKTLKKSLMSIINQSNSNWEIIAVNDGSTDSSLEILNGLASDNPNIRVINQKNAGPGAARNTGVQYATGEYIAFVDADDCIREDYVEVVLDKFNSSHADVVCIDLAFVLEDGKIIGREIRSQYSNLTKEELTRLQITGKLGWGPTGKIIKRNLILENGLKYSTDCVAEEILFSLGALIHAQKIAFVNQAMYFYLRNLGGQHARGGIDPWKNATVNMKNYLKEANLYDMYEKSLNSLALRALCICCYRCSLNYTYREARKQMKAKMQEYKENYSLKKSTLDWFALDKTSKLLFPLIRLNCRTLLIFFSKIRKNSK